MSEHDKHKRGGRGTALLAGGALVLILNGCALHDSAYYSERVTICHKGNQTLVIPENAVSAHLAHGDERGPCEDED